MTATLSFDEACDYLKISAGSLADLIACGEVRAAKISKCWVLRASDLDEYLDEKIAEQTQARIESFRAGRVAKIKPALTAVRKARRELPDLEPYLEQAGMAVD